MKKIIFIAMLLVLMGSIGCYGQGKPEKMMKILKVKNVSITQYLKKHQLINSGCSKYIVVDVSNMTPAQLNDWEDNNRSYYPTILPGATANCNTEKRYIDMDTFIKIEQDYNKTKLAYWLKINSDDICYADMFNIIDCYHLIVDPNIINVLEQPMTDFQEHDTMKLKDLKTALGTYYNSENYKNYIRLSFDTGKIKIESPKSYNPNDNYYSIPLLKNIERNPNYTVNDDTVFEFRAFYIVSSKPILAIAMSFKDTAGHYHHYDFSQNPLVTSSGVTNSFSPL